MNSLVPAPDSASGPAPVPEPDPASWGRRWLPRTAASVWASCCSASPRSEPDIAASSPAVPVSSARAQAVPDASSSSSAAEPSVAAPSVAAPSAEASSPDSSSVQASSATSPAEPPASYVSPRLLSHFITNSGADAFSSTPHIPRSTPLFFSPSSLFRVSPLVAGVAGVTGVSGATGATGAFGLSVGGTFCMMLRERTFSSRGGAG